MEDLITTVSSIELPHGMKQHSLPNVSGINPLEKGMNLQHNQLNAFSIRVNWHKG